MVVMRTRNIGDRLGFLPKGSKKKKIRELTSTALTMNVVYLMSNYKAEVNRMPLEKELETYQANLSDLLNEDEGKYVLIHEDKIQGTYSSFEDALKEGYRAFGLKPFLVKQIQKIEYIQMFTRILDVPCPT